MERRTEGDEGPGQLCVRKFCLSSLRGPLYLEIGSLLRSLDSVKDLIITLGVFHYP